jgi:hypothetical protein
MRTGFGQHCGTVWLLRIADRTGLCSARHSGLIKAAASLAANTVDGKILRGACNLTSQLLNGLSQS